MINESEYLSLSREELAVLLRTGGEHRVICFQGIKADDPQKVISAQVKLIADGILELDGQNCRVSESAAVLLTPIIDPVAVLTLCFSDERYLPKIYYVRNSITVLEHSRADRYLLGEMSREEFITSVLEHPAMHYLEFNDGNVQSQAEDMLEAGADEFALSKKAELTSDSIFIMECLGPDGTCGSWLHGLFRNNKPELELHVRKPGRMPLTENNLKLVLKRLWRNG